MQNCINAPPPVATNAREPDVTRHIPPGGAPDQAVLALALPLAQFAAVARHEHLTQAADELGMSQPTLSRAMQRLEAQLGVPLFLHAGRGIQLTAHGRALLEYAEQALSVLDAAGRELASAADAEYGLVRLAYLKSLGARLVPKLLRVFHAEHPHVRFQLTEASSQRMEELLRSGDVDLCLIAPEPVGAGIESLPLRRQEMRLTVSTAHRWAERGQVRLAEAAGEDFVAMNEGYGTRALADAFCRTAGFAPRVVFAADNIETVRGLVAAELGIALLPYEGVSRPGTADLPLARTPRDTTPAFDPSRTLCLAWPAHTVRPAAVSLTHRFLREQFSE